MTSVLHGTRSESLLRRPRAGSGAFCLFTCQGCKDGDVLSLSCTALLSVLTMAGLKLVVVALLAFFLFATSSSTCFPSCFVFPFLLRPALQVLPVPSTKPQRMVFVDVYPDEDEDAKFTSRDEEGAELGGTKLVGSNLLGAKKVGGNLS